MQKDLDICFFPSQDVKKSYFYGAKKICEISNKKPERQTFENKIMFERFAAKVEKSEKRPRLEPETRLKPETSSAATNQEDNEFEELLKLYKKRR